MKSLKWFIFLGVLILLIIFLRPTKGLGRPLPVPKDVIETPWLLGVMNNQLGVADELGVFHDFRFVDKSAESGIDFRHHIVDDASNTYKAVHYDHGNGVAVADVNGDGNLDIYFVNQVGGNELWENLGNGKFKNVTKRAGVAVEGPVSVSASFADIDNDGDPDLYVTTIQEGNFLFENDGEGKFRDISKGSGLDHKGFSSAGVFFDYNRDGLLDLLVTNVGQFTSDELLEVTNFDSGNKDYRFYGGFTDAFSGHLDRERLEISRLFKNLGDNKFEDVTESVGLIDSGWTGDASPLDVNEDGWPDLYLLNMQGSDEYYENVRGERFVKKSRDVFPKTPWGSMGIKVFDYNNDGELDVYITDMHSDMSKNIDPEEEEEKADIQWSEEFLQTGGQSIFGNAFFERTGGGFREVSDKIGAENYWPWGLSVGDLNADGYEDVFVTASMNFPFRYSPNILLLNDKGEEFKRSEFILGVEPRKDGKTAQPWFNLDCDKEDKHHANCHEQSGRVTVWGALGSRSSAIFDLDHDGDLDIVTSEFNNKPMVLLSDLSQRKDINYLEIELVGNESNRDGLGSLVKVNTSSGSFLKVHDGKSGYLSQSSQPLYFGLGNVETVDSIEITWPTGKKSSIESPIEVNRLLVMEE